MTASVCPPQAEAAAADAAQTAAAARQREQLNAALARAAAAEKAAKAAAAAAPPRFARGDLVSRVIDGEAFPARVVEVHEGAPGGARGGGATYDLRYEVERDDVSVAEMSCLTASGDISPRQHN